MASSGRWLRVIAGEMGGRRLVAPAGRLRPTADRVKESVFSALGAGRLVGARVLDLYAGTGALAIEALSRGAATALLVDRDRAAVRAIAQNLDALGLTERAVVLQADVDAVVRAGAGGEPFDLVFADPPYELADEAIARLLAGLSAGGWVAAAGTVVVERGRSGGPPDLPPGWGSTWKRCYGDTLVWFAEISEGDG